MRLADCFDIAFEQPTLVNSDIKVLEVLVENGKIARGVDEYNFLHGIDRSLSMPFFVKHYDNYAPYIPEMDIDEYDIRDIFDEEYHLTAERKLHILENIDAEKYVTEYNFYEITNFLLQQEITSNSISQGIKAVVEVLLMLENEPVLKRIELFNKFPVYTEADDINSMLSTFGSEYYNGTHIKYHIPSNLITLKFCKALVKVGYLDRYTNYGRSRKFITTKLK